MPRSAQTFGRSAFFTPSRSRRWLPVTFTMRTLYFSATSAMRRSSCGRGDAAAHARHHRKCSVLLNIGVYAIVDESRRAILFMPAAPQHVQHVAQRRLADLAALAVSVHVQDFLHRFQLLPAHDVAKLLIGERQAGAQRRPGLLLEFRRHRAQQLLAQTRAASATASRRACSSSARSAW